MPQLAGLRLAPLSQTLTAGVSTTWRFRIIGCDGNPVRHFDRDNTKLLHLILILVRTDLTGYQHLHPALESSVDGYDVELQRPAQLMAGQEAHSPSASLARVSPSEISCPTWGHTGIWSGCTPQSSPTRTFTPSARTPRVARSRSTRS
jgi:hypothetical protein